MKSKFLILTLVALAALAFAATAPASIDSSTYSRVVAAKPGLGDVVFTRRGGPLFGAVADASGTWTSHVGIIVDYDKGDWIVAESGIPFVRKTPLRTFLGRSSGEKFAIMRFKDPMTERQKQALLALADHQLGRVYDLGFNIESSRTFCSKFVYEIVRDDSGRTLGQVETFDHLLKSNPKAPLFFWKVWYLGTIPWIRETITPASQLNSPLLVPVATHNI